MLNTLRHLLPNSTAWRMVVDRLLKKYLTGVSSVGTDAVAFIDDVYDDLWPDTTRELAEWEVEFDLGAIGSEASRRAALAAAWAATGGQGPDYLEAVIQLAGWPTAKVFDSFDRTDNSLSKYHGHSQTTIGAQDIAPSGLAFAAGGRIMYLVGRVSNTVYQYDLGGDPYDIDLVSPGPGAVYNGKSFTVVEDTAATDVHVSHAGDRMFVLGSTGDAVYQYTLTTPFDVSTAVYDSVSFSVAAQETVPQAFCWKPDGTSFYLTGSDNDNIDQYDLGTAWDLSTAAHAATVSSTIVNPAGIAIKDDGTQLFTARLSDGIMFTYDLSTPWDLSTAAVDTSKNLDLAAATGDANPLRIYFEHGMLFVVGIGENDVYRLTFGGPRYPLDYANQPLTGLTQCGDDGTEASGETPIAQCGEQPDDQVSILSAVCDNFLANEIWYLWNKNLTKQAPPGIPDGAEEDSLYWANFWYVGTGDIGDVLIIKEEDRARFEKLLLKLGPLEKWIVTIINVIVIPALLGEWEYDDTPWTGGAPTGGLFQLNAAGTLVYINVRDVFGTLHDTDLLAMVENERVRLERQDNGEWAEYRMTGPAGSGTNHAILGGEGITEQSDGWAFPADGTRMNVYTRKLLV